MKKNYIFLLILFFSINIIHSQDFWNPLNGPTGVDVVEIGVDYFGNMYISARGKENIFRSTDNGITWNSFNDGLVKNNYRVSVTKFVNAPDSSLYTYFYDQVYKLKPNSLNWEKVKITNKRFSINDISINPNGDIFVAGDREVYRSKDNGKTFKVIFKRWSHRVKLSTNGNNINFMIASNGATDRLYSFDDDGKNYKQINFPSNSAEGMFYDNVSNKLYVYSRSGFYFSENYGKNWKKVFHIGATRTNYATMLPSGLIYCHNRDGLFISENKGLDWTKIIDSKPRLFSSIQTIKPIINNNLFVLIQNPCKPNYFPLSIASKDFDEIKEIKTQIKQATVLGLSKDLDGRIYTQLHYNTYMISDDDGESWEEINIQESIKSLKHDNKGNMYAISINYELYRSLDKGVTWKKLTINSDEEIKVDKIFLNPDGRLYVVSLNDYLYITDDFGETWIDNNKRFGGYFYDMSIAKNGDIYILSYDGIFKFDENADNMEQILKLDNISLYSGFHIAKNGDIYLSLENFSFFEDLDELWKLENDSLVKIPYPYGCISSINSNSAGDIFVVSYGKIYHTTDYGQTWTLINYNLPPNIVKSIYVDENDFIYLLPINDVIYKSLRPTVENNFVYVDVFYDYNENCIKDTNEIALEGWELNLKGDYEKSIKTNNNGNYRFNLKNGDYSLKIYNQDEDLWDFCNNIYNFNLNSIATDTSYISFAVQAKEKCSALSLNSSLSLFSRCKSNYYKIRYKNTGTDTSRNTVISVEMDSFLIYENSNLPILSQIGNKIEFMVGDLPINEECQLNIELMVSCDAPNGIEHCIYSSISSDSDICDVPGVTFDTICQINNDSVIPFEKLAFVDGHQVDKDTIKQSDRVTYHIRFQNIEEDTIKDIIVSDYLPYCLDINSIKIEASSHDVSMRVIDFPEELLFTFSNINLPPYSNNPILSQGYIDFSIAINDYYGHFCTSISNIGEIYMGHKSYDTNLNTISLEDPLSTEKVKAKNQRIIISPQPFDYRTKIVVDDIDLSKKNIFTVFNNFGQKVFDKKIDSDEFYFYRNNLPQGIYFYSLKNAKGIVATGKLVIQ